MATERKAPDVLIVQDNLNGAVGDIQDDPDSPDGAWLTAISNNVNSIARVSFPTPTGAPNVGADLQEFRALVRKMGGTGTPEARLELWENGGLIREGTLEDITTDTVINLTWNASELGTPDGSLVECRLYGKKSGGGPSARAAIEVGAIEWNVDYTTGGEFVYAGDVPVSILPDDPKAKLSKSYIGNILLSALPSYTSIRTMVYTGAVPLVAIPAAPIAPLEKSYAGAVGLALMPVGTYALLYEYVYAGDLAMAILPSSTRILDRIYSGDIPLVALPDFPVAPLSKSYGGDIGLVLTPESIYELVAGAGEFVYAGDIPLIALPSSTRILDRVYAGDVSLIALPSYSLILDRIYSGAVTLSVLPEFPKAILEKGYLGDVAFVLTPESAYLLERVIIEYIYAGSIPLSALPSHSYALAMAYKGDINLSALSTCLSSGIRAALDSYHPAQPSKDEKEPDLIGEKQIVFLTPKERR